MANIVTGIIEHIGNTTQEQSTDGQKTFYRRELVINAKRFDPYTGESVRDNFVSLRLSGERCKELDHFKQGDLVDASYILDGFKYQDKDSRETKYFTRISCYKVELHNKNVRPAQPTAQPTPPPAQPTQQYEPFPHQPFEEPKPNDGGLPF